MTIVCFADLQSSSNQILHQQQKHEDLFPAGSNITLTCLRADQELRIISSRLCWAKYPFPTIRQQLAFDQASGCCFMPVLSKMCFPWKELLTRPLSTCWRECLRTGLRHASVTKILPPAYETQGFAYARQPYYEVLDRSLLTWNLNVFLGIPAYPFYDIHKLISYMICIYCKCVCAKRIQKPRVVPISTY